VYKEDERRRDVFGTKLGMEVEDSLKGKVKFELNLKDQ
jgi:hypothetical protein